MNSMRFTSKKLYRVTNGVATEIEKGGSKEFDGVNSVLAIARYGMDAELFAAAFDRGDAEIEEVVYGGEKISVLWRKSLTEQQKKGE